MISVSSKEEAIEKYNELVRKIRSIQVNSNHTIVLMRLRTLHVEEIRT